MRFGSSTTPSGPTKPSAKITPASRYRPASRAYPSKLPSPEHPRHYLVKRVTDAGTCRFQHHLLYVANALVDEYIGLEETDDGVWTIYFNNVLIATLDERDYTIRAELLAGLNPCVKLVPAHTMLLGLAQEHGCTYEQIG